MTSGSVREIFITRSQGEPMISVNEAEALPGKGLAGDRYASGTGFYSATPTTPGARELTLIDLGAVEAAARETGCNFSTADCRRNLITHGVDLDTLIGQRFTIGEVVCEGVRGCPPCLHLEDVTDMKVMKALVRTGGLRARIVTGGTIRPGDRIDVTGPSSGPSEGNRARG